MFGFLKRRKETNEVIASVVQRNMEFNNICQCFEQYNKAMKDDIAELERINKEVNNQN